MSNTGLDVFDTTIQKTNALLREIELALNWEGKRRESYDALRGVLQTLRDRLTVEEIAHFSAQLPLLVRGIFYEEWDPTHLPIKMDKEQFLQTIAERGNLEGKDVEDLEGIVRVILQAVKSYVSAGEIEDVKGILPKDIASLI